MESNNFTSIYRDLSCKLLDGKCLRFNKQWVSCRPFCSCSGNTSVCLLGQTARHEIRLAGVLKHFDEVIFFPALPSQFHLTDTPYHQQYVSSTLINCLSDHPLVITEALLHLMILLLFLPSLRIHLRNPSPLRTNIKAHLLIHISHSKKQSYSQYRPWKSIELWDVKVPKLSGQSVHIWWQGYFCTSGTHFC
jgi:hypothetical protein